jgi:23S rRNA (cytidine1920-2'-O)/16S rRNA (cytidine1409-2'-O)-methyltransferase
MAEADCPYVSRGGLKLEHALREFGIDAHGLVCADLGASTGGFTDCLLKHGAARVYSVDTAYGELAWTLRNDPRVVVMERSNALHTDPPPGVAAATSGVGGEGGVGGVDLVVLDLGWTRQQFAIPAALKWLKPGGRIISLIKPHYEVGERARAGGASVVLPEPEAEAIANRVAAQMPEWGARTIAMTKSPVLGGALSVRKKVKGAGNAEWLALVERTTSHT